MEEYQWRKRLSKNISPNIGDENRHLSLPNQLDFLSKNISPNIGDENVATNKLFSIIINSKNISPNIGDENDEVL